MSDQSPLAGIDGLQFDRVAEGTSPSATVTVTCSSCQASIDTEYFDVNGHVVCERCRGALEATAETPRGLMPLLGAGVFGFGAAVAGALIYYAVIAITNLEIGLIAILCGYMVGYAVRKGARGRGGRRFQVLAVVLTYVSIALAYTPIVVKQVIDERREQKASATNGDAAVNNAGATDLPRLDSSASVIYLVAVFAALMLALPVVVIVGSLPSGLISALIMAIGMRQAWKMTGAPQIQVLGPYRVGASQVPTST